MINITKTYLPDFDLYTKTIKRAWDKGWITNNGELVQELEDKLKAYLGVKHLFFTCNGTIVLQMALKAFNITKEVVTTPFSYVATVNAIVWEGCTPVFADINENDYCIDPDKIEEKITDNTQAILATHVYGYPCDIEKIKKLATKYGLKVIYDGAHAFGSVYQKRSLLSYGDISTCSFHATKLFHTVEGGCVITDDDEIANKLMLFRQFGHVYDDYYSVGLNAKNSEFHAAMGLCNLPNIDSIINERQELFTYYRSILKDSIHLLNDKDDFKNNYGYLPVVFKTEDICLKIKSDLERSQIFARRYFYPSLNTLPYVSQQECRISESVSSRVLCLPLFVGLLKSDVDYICSIIKKWL